MALTIPVTDLKLYYFPTFFRNAFLFLCRICSVAKAESVLCWEFNLWDLVFWLFSIIFNYILCWQIMWYFAIFMVAFIGVPLPFLCGF